MTDQPRDEMPQSPEAGEPASEPPESQPAFRDWQHRLGPRNQPGSPTSAGGFLYMGMELRRPKKPPPSSPEPPPSP